MAEEHAELLGAAGDGRRRRLDLPQGLVRQARAAGGVQGEVRLGSRRADDLRPAEADRRVLPEAARSTARPSTAPRSTPSAARKASPWAPWTCSTASASSTRTPTSPTRWKASSTPTKSVAGLEFYKALYDCCTPPGASNSYMGEGVDAFKSGQVAMHMNFAFTWPGLQKDEKVGGDKIGFFVNPGRPDGEQFAQLGGQGISVVSYSDNRTRALQYIKWFANTDVQAKWWSLGGFSCLKAVVEDPGFAASQPYAQTFLDSMAIVKDFWAEPSYASLLQAIAEALPRLCRRRPGHRQGSPRRAGRGLDRSLRGRRQDLEPAPPKPVPRRVTWRGTEPPIMHDLRSGKPLVTDTNASMLDRAAEAAARATPEPLAKRGARPVATGASPGCSSRRRCILLLAINIFPLIWAIWLSLHQLPRQPAERRVKNVGLSQLRAHPRPTATSGSPCRRRRISSSGRSCCRR